MSITVKQIKEWPIGERCGAFILTIKTCKGVTVLGVGSGDERGWQRAMLADSDGDAILAELPLNGGVKLQRTARVRLWAERAELELSNKMVPGLKVDRWEYAETFSEPPEQDIHKAWQEDIRIVKQKIRHGKVDAWMQAGYINPVMCDADKDHMKKEILYWQEFVLTGE
jgi:hypothetical protein